MPLYRRAAMDGRGGSMSCRQCGRRSDGTSSWVNVVGQCRRAEAFASRIVWMAQRIIAANASAPALQPEPRRHSRGGIAASIAATRPTRTGELRVRPPCRHRRAMLLPCRRRGRDAAAWCFVAGGRTPPLRHGRRCPALPCASTPAPPAPPTPPAPPAPYRNAPLPTLPAPCGDMIPTPRPRRPRCTRAAHFGASRWPSSALVVLRSS
jgi:hypothetical protein